MKQEIKVPVMGESISEAVVSELLVQSGQQVAMDQEILELETDKVNQVLYAPQAGVVTFTVQVDDTVTIDQVIGHIDTDGQATVEASEAPASKEEAAPPPASAAETPVKSSGPASSSGHKVRVNVKEAVRELQKPSTPAPAAASTETAPSKEAVPVGERETRKRMTQIRKVIANRLVEAQQSTAMLTTFNEVNMGPVMDLRAKYKDEFEKVHGVRMGFMGFFTKAVVSALKAFPLINASIDGTEIVQRHYYDIGIAVGTERGLVVPVIRDCDQLQLADIERELRVYAKKAREGGLSMADLEGGCFTITNGGVYGSMLSTPILNMPQSGILGMHNITKRAVVIDDEIVIRPMMYLALSYDHRIVDGKEAVSFLVHMKNLLEDPARFLLHV